MKYRLRKYTFDYLLKSWPMRTIRKEGGQFSSSCSFLPHITFFKRNQCSGSTRYFGLSLYDNENDFYSLCTYERRTTYRSLTPTFDRSIYVWLLMIQEKREKTLSGHTSCRTQCPTHFGLFAGLQGTLLGEELTSSMLRMLSPIRPT